MKLFDFSKNEIYIFFGMEGVLIWYDKLNVISRILKPTLPFVYPAHPYPGVNLIFWCFDTQFVKTVLSQYYSWIQWIQCDQHEAASPSQKKATSFDQITRTKRALVEVSCSWFKELQRLMCKSEINWWCKQKLLRTFNHASLIQMLLFKDN